MKYYLSFVILVFQQVLFSISVNSQSLNNGLLDVTNVSWDNNIIKLEGSCDFYWKEFLVPSSSDDSLLNYTRYSAQIPKPWTKIALSVNNYCPADGYGTYRVRIKVDNRDEVYGLKINTVFSSYTLYVNGKLITSAGKVGKSKEESHPQFQTKEIPLPVYAKDSIRSQILDVVLHVSNYHHRRAGAQRPIFFSTMDEIIRSTKTSLLIHLLLLGIIFTIGFIHVLMYAIRRIDFANLLFGALATIMILRDITTGERIILHMFPNMEWETLVRLDNFSGFGTMTFFALYFYFTFRKDFPKFMFYFLVGFGAIITILVFTTNQWFYGQFRTLLEAYVGLGGLYYTFGILLVAVFRKREGAFFTFLGMFLLYTTAINDVLSSMGIINTAYIAPYGIAAFMFLQSFILTRKSALALVGNQKLSDELSNEKLNLEKRIEERTHKLTKQADELKVYQEEQEQQNHINEGLNLITEVMRQNKDNLSALADQLLATLIRRVDASMGAMYLHSTVDHEEKLKLLAHYGLTKEAKIDLLDLNEGLTGQCFNTGKESYIEDISDEYFLISSGLGSASPKGLALVPMKIDELIIGVVEIASFKPISETHKSFLTKAIENISAQINIVKMNDESKIMIQESQMLEEEATAQNQEMMENMEELKALQEEAENKEKEIQDLLAKAKEREATVEAQLSDSYKQQAVSQERLKEVLKENKKLKKKK